MLRHLDRKLSMLLGILSLVLMLPSLTISKFATEEISYIDDVINVIYITNESVLYYIIAFIGMFLSCIFMRRAFHKTSIFSFISTALMRVVLYIARVSILFSGVFEANTWYLMKGTFSVQTIVLLSSLIIPFFFLIPEKKKSSPIIDAT